MDELGNPKDGRSRGQKRWGQFAFMAILLLAAGLGWFFVWLPQQVKADPHAIVLAMFPQPKDGPDYSDDAIIRAIDRFGNVNGYSEADQLSFVAAAAVADQMSIFDWLVAQGANPNPPNGIHPLLVAIEAGNYGRAKRMLSAGCKVGTGGRRRDSRRTRAGTQPASARPPHAGRA
jgi:hypothetical protein